MVAAGDTFLSYGDSAKAVTFYERALTLPGVDADLANTRLGIAQIQLGDFAAARSAFALVTGSRAPIAILWTAYADQLEGA